MKTFRIDFGCHLPYASAMANRKAKTTPAPKRAPARRAGTAKKTSASDLTPVETIRLSPEETKSLGALRLFAQVYEKL
jgi:hypothetical protein